MIKSRNQISDNVTKTHQTILDHRLCRLDGQVQALRRMVGNGDDWKKMLTLAAAIEGAADQVSADLFRGYLDSLAVDETVAAKAREGLELVLKRR
jgi:DNA-binding FrmR family transcriptional regulator